jgi:LmbE family N-acetylglucosaminyl deacetylase
MNNDVSQLGSILGIWAHPDDETFMVGGLLAMAAANGQKVACVTATKGEAGVQDALRWPAETLGETRANELAKALEILGVGNHQWLDYPDGGCASAPEVAAVERLVAIINEFKPDSIITFPPDGLTGHNDHVAVSAWATAAAVQSEVSPKVWYAVHTEEVYGAAFKSIDDTMNVYFNIDTPKFVQQSLCDISLELPDEILDKKLRALKSMPSQYEAFFNGITPQDAELAFELEGLVLSTRWGDL